MSTGRLTTTRKLTAGELAYIRGDTEEPVGENCRGWRLLRYGNLGVRRREFI